LSSSPFSPSALYGCAPRPGESSPKTPGPDAKFEPGADFEQRRLLKQRIAAQSNWIGTITIYLALVG
jgi:hypothetical protein